MSSPALNDKKGLETPKDNKEQEDWDELDNDVFKYTSQEIDEDKETYLILLVHGIGSNSQT